MKTIPLTTDGESITEESLVELIDGVETARPITDDDKLEVVYLYGGVPASVQTSLQEQLANEKQAWLDAKGALNAAHRTAIDNVRAERTFEIDTLNKQITEAQEQLATAQGEASSVPNLQAQLDTALARIAELEAVPDEPVVLGVSKLTIMRRLGDKWPTLKAALSTLPEIVQDAWLLAQEIRADDELFLAYKETLKTLLDLTDDEFNALLTP